MQGSRRTTALLSAAAAAVAALALPALAAADTLAPDSPHSPGADDTQIAYIVMVVLATVIALALIVGLLIAARSRRTAGKGARRARGGRLLPIGALLVLAAAVFVFGVVMTESSRNVEATGPDGLTTTTAQTDLDLPSGSKPLEIKASGQRWLWRYEYPDGTFSYYELVVPVDTAVVLDISSTDVEHSWWVPSLAGQFATTPESPNKTWFKADKVGVYEGRSTEFSGPGYATMRTAVRVVEPAEYQAWLKQQATDIADAQKAVADALASGDAPGGTFSE